VSETIDCGRYPVRVFELEDIDAGHALFRRDLNTYHECRINNEWGGVETIKRPEWARKQDAFYERIKPYPHANATVGTAAAIFSPEGKNQLSASLN
jgi:hypothetical protein